MTSLAGLEAAAQPRAPDGAAAPDILVPEPPPRGVSVRAMEIATALCFAAAGGVAVGDSLRLGAGWGADGPQSGYFPFWIGVLLLAAATGQLVVVARAMMPRGGEMRGRPGPMFLTRDQARTVATVFVPTVLYVAAIPLSGLYVASAALVAWFMLRLGGFAAWRAVLAGIAAALVAFVVFEIWFLVALPKGPLEDFLGY